MPAAESVRMKTGKLVSLISLTMANVVGLSLVTLAWFTTRPITDGDAGNIAVIKDQVVKEVNFYPYSSKMSGTKTQYYFDKTPISSKTLGYYSIINSGYQLLMEIVLESEMSISVTAETYSDSYLGIVERDENDNPIYSLHATGNSLSSIVCFYGLNNTELTINETFYSVDLTTYSSRKTNFINADYTDLVDDKKARVCQFSNTDRVYVVIDYDEISIETIYSANLGNDITSGVGDDMTVVDGHSYITYSADFCFYINKIEGLTNG
ncbi:MAG: hypothetical protein MJ238_00160 [Bacilli bacterium]|nr:hypothetical protein [Bacilli bacterium]